MGDNFDIKISNLEMVLSGLILYIKNYIKAHKANREFERRTEDPFGL